MAKISALIEKIADGKNPLFQDLYGVNEIVLKEQADRYAALMNEFQSVYGNDDVSLFSSPGRTEIGGNHTDHNRGKVLACDSPAHLKHMLQGEALFQVWVSADGSLDSAGLLAINGVNQAAAQETPEGLRIDLRLQEESVLPAVFNELNRQQRAIFSLQKREPTLEDVFMRLVGQRMEDIEDDSAAAA